MGSQISHQILQRYPGASEKSGTVGEHPCKTPVREAEKHDLFSVRLFINHLPHPHGFTQNYLPSY